MAGLPLYAIANAGFDDAYFVKTAANILAGKWFGPYDHMTLIKGPLFPLWLAINWLLGLPLLLHQSILFAGSGLLLLGALEERLRAKWAGVAIYAFYLFNPVGFTLDGLRILRERIYIPWTVLLIALFAWNLRTRDSSVRVRFVWAATLGLALGCYWLIREEGMWVVPGLLAAYSGLFLMKWKTSIQKTLHQEWRYPVTAGLAALLVIQSFSFINWAMYGTRDVVEFKQPEFVSAYSALTRLQTDAGPRLLPLPRSVWPQIAAASPRFREIQPFFDNKWAQTACAFYQISPCDGEIRGSWLMWALREAVHTAGHYRSPDAARTFYSALAQEINAACATEQLLCLPPRNSLTPPFRWSYVGLTAQAFLRSLAIVGRLEGLDIRPANSTGPIQYYMDFMGDLAHSKVMPMSIQRTVLGAIHLRDTGTISLAVTDPGAASNTFINVFETKQFELTTSCLSPECFLEVRANGHLTGRMALSDLQPGREIALSTGVLKISKVFQSDSKTYLPNVTRSTLLLQSLHYIGKAYQILFPLLLILGLIFFGLRIAATIRAGQLSPLFLINATLLLWVGSRLLLLSYMDVTSMPVLTTLYLGPVYPLLLLFAGFAPLDWWNNRQPK